MEKKEYFFIGEVFFLLTRPLMGDPFTLQIQKSTYANIVKIISSAILN